MLVSKKILFLLGICSFVFQSHAISERDSIRLGAFLEASKSLANFDLDKSFSQLRSIKKKAEEEKSLFLMSAAYNTLGDVFLKIGDVDSALFYVEKAIHIRLKINLKEYLATSYESFANIHYFIGENETALDYCRKSLTIKSKIDNPTYLKGLYNNLGRIHVNLENYDSSIYYHEKAYAIYMAQSDRQGVASTLNNLGNTLYMMDNEYGAIKKYQEAVIVFESENRIKETIIPLINLGEVFVYLGQYDSALYYNRKALNYAKIAGDNYFYQHYENLAICYEEEGKLDSAIQMLELYIESADSIFSIVKARSIFDADKKFRTKETTQLLIYEKEKSDRLAAEAASKRKTIYILLVLIFIIVVGIILIMRITRQKNELSKLELNVKNQEIDKLLKDQEAKSYAALIEGQNYERERIANDLHDQLGGTLAAVKVHFNLMDKRINELQTENRELFNKVDEMLGSAVRDVRRISHDLVSGQLAKLGLKGAIQDLANILTSAKNIEVNFFMDDSLPKFDPKKEQEIYAIIQELVSNTLKHAAATVIDIQLNRQDDICNLIFEDNGVGFDMAKIEFKGLGLKSLTNRVHKLEGKMSIDSFVGRGTITIIDIPT